MFDIGQRVKIKSLERIKEEGNTMLFNGIPHYAVSSMLRLYGDHVSYPIIKEPDLRNLVRVRCDDDEYVFELQDLEIDSEPEPLPLDNERVILKKTAHGFRAGAILKVLHVASSGEDGLLFLDCLGGPFPVKLSDITLARGIPREESGEEPEKAPQILYNAGDKIVLNSDPEFFLDYYRNTGNNYFAMFGQVLTLRGDVTNRDRRAVVFDEWEGTTVIPVALISGLKPNRYTPPAQHFYQCTRCGNWYIVDPHEDVYYEDQELCPVCRERKYITPYHRYSPHLDFWQTGGDDNLYLGAEIEIDNGGESDRTAAMIVEHMNPKGKWFMYCSHDGSLDEGLEMITSPATLNYHMSIKDKYANLFRKLAKMGYRSHSTSTCGLHVHFSRDFFAENEEENICKLLYLVEKFWDEIIVFSRRDYRSIDRYAKKMDRSTKDFFSSWNKSGMHDGHYYAVNITNPNTIELRMFRGTINVETYLATLAFVDSIVRTAKRCSAEELQAISFEEILPDCAKEYYQSRKLVSKFDSEDGNVNLSDFEDAINQMGSVSALIADNLYTLAEEPYFG